MEVTEALIDILKRSHNQTQTGQTFTMSEVEHFMHDMLAKLNEVT